MPCVVVDFYPRPPRGGRPSISSRNEKARVFLSTPSARRATHSTAAQPWGHKHFYPRPPRGGRPFGQDDRGAAAEFLSTPSARRATSRPGVLRAGHIDFYPRPPRGGRRYWIEQYNIDGWISIHALREEGDACMQPKARSRSTFLSTPSARRATAKTETKSLFSNKLYNILHEFRRALIYNGSKNYPNHAK